MEEFNKSIAYHNHFIYHNLEDDILVRCKQDGYEIEGRCIDISLGGIGIVCDEFLPLGETLEVEINLNLLAEGNFSENTSLKVKVVGNFDMGNEKLNGMELQLTRDSFRQLREANNYLTKKMSSDEIFAILQESGVHENDTLM